jgi:hypothetical protein
MDNKLNTVDTCIKMDGPKELKMQIISNIDNVFYPIQLTSENNNHSISKREQIG